MTVGELQEILTVLPKGLKVVVPSIEEGYDLEASEVKQVEAMRDLETEQIVTIR